MESHFHLPFRSTTSASLLFLAVASVSPKALVAKITIWAAGREVPREVEVAGAPWSATLGTRFQYVPEATAGEQVRGQSIELPEGADRIDVQLQTWGGNNVSPDALLSHVLLQQHLPDASNLPHPTITIRGE